jgi:hypothetical protein
MFGPTGQSAWGGAAEPLLDAATAGDSDGDGDEGAPGEAPAVPPAAARAAAPPLPAAAAHAGDAAPVDLREQGAPRQRRCGCAWPFSVGAWP